MLGELDSTEEFGRDVTLYLYLSGRGAFMF